MSKGVRYDIRPTEAGWSWSTYDHEGGLVAAGQVKSRAVAAACVIRCIATAVQPVGALKQAA